MKYNIGLRLALESKEPAEGRREKKRVAGETELIEPETMVVLIRMVHLNAALVNIGLMKLHVPECWLGQG